MAAPTRFRTVTVDGLSLFYRDAGPADAPSVLLLHGFPSSSRMWQPLIDRLCDRYRLVAPDYPGFGHSDAPPADTFDYTFDHIADVIDKFAETVGLKRYSPRRRARAAVGNAAGVLGRPSRPRTGAPRELLLPRPNSSTARRQEPAARPLRPVLRSRRGRGVPARRAERRGARDRCGPFPSRRSPRSGFGAHRPIPGRVARCMAVVMSSKSMRPW